MRPACRVGEKSQSGRGAGSEVGVGGGGGNPGFEHRWKPRPAMVDRGEDGSNTRSHVVLWLCALERRRPRIASRAGAEAHSSWVCFKDNNVGDLAVIT